MMKFLLNCSLVLGGICAGILLAELVVYVISPQPVLHATAPDIFFVEYDEEIGWVNRPGAEGTYTPDPGVPAFAVRINKLGLRGKTVALEKPPGVKRVLILGDSNTFGYGISEDERFSDLLSSMLPQGYEVLNLGVFGYGTDQEALLFEREGLRFNPDIVVLAVSAGDLSDNMNSVNWGTNKPYFVLEGDRLVLRNVPVPHSAPLLRTGARSSPFKGFLYRHSHLYRLALKRLMAANIYVHNSVREMTEPEALMTTAAIISVADRLCRMSGCQLVVLLISHGEWVASLKEHPDRAVGYYPPLKGILAQEGVRVLDPSESFLREPAETGPLFFPNDPVHLTAGGNKVVAESLYRMLAEEGYLEAIPSREPFRRLKESP